MNLQHLTVPSRDGAADGGASAATSTREHVMGRLLDDDPLVRRTAFARAVSRRWIDRGDRTVVRAVSLAADTGRSRAADFGRRLASTAPAPTTFVREVDSVVYLVTREVGSDTDFDDWIATKAARAGVVVVATGSARHKPMSGDLGDAAEQARIAVDLTAALPELQPSQSIDELGGWVLLNSVAADSRVLSDFSPAAAWLHASADPVQRNTIETYLDCGGQARAACAQLHIHRTTLYYRLDNMPAVVRDALDDGMKRSTLHMTLKLIRLWESTGALEVASAQTVRRR